MSAIPQRRIYRTNIQMVQQKMNIKEWLKLLQSNEFLPLPWEDFKKELQLKPHLGDHIQYELHKYCQKDFTKIDEMVVIKLSELCYSPDSVSCFANIERFVGCVYYISGYLLKKEKYESALNVVSSLVIKKKEIVNCSEENSGVKTYLHNLYSSFMASANALASKVQSELDLAYRNSHKLAVESIKFLMFTNSKQSEVLRKILKNSTLYLQSLKVYNENYVAEFYNTISSACNSVLPNLGNYYYCQYYLHKMSYLDKLDLEEVHLVLQKTVYLVTVILGCSKSLHKVLNKILDFFWKNCNEHSWITDEDFIALSGYNGSSSYRDELYFLLVSIICNYGIQFLWKKYEQNWSERFSAFDIMRILGTILTYHERYIKKTILYCEQGMGPFQTCFAYLNSRNLQKIQFTVRLCLKNKVADSLTLIPISRRAYKLAMECFKAMMLRECCSENADYLWKSTVIHHMNTVEDISRLQPLSDIWCHLRDCCQEIIKSVIQSDLELPFDFNRVKVLFQRWHTANLKLGNYREALFVCVVYGIFYPKEEKDFMSMWLQTKAEASNDIIEEAITSETFKNHEKNFKELCKTEDVSNVCLKSILIMELRAYSTCSPKTFLNPNSPKSLATKIWKQLEKYDLELWEMSLALSFLILFFVSTDTETLPNHLHKKCKSLIQDLCNEQGVMQCRSPLHTANLTFSLFLFNVKRTERNEGKMDTTNVILDYLKKAEVDKVKFGEDVDLNLTCDVIPSSSQLTVELETNYLNELNKIVDLWSRALEKCNEESVTALEFDLWLQNLKKVAHMYELMGESRWAFTTWIMHYKIGKLCKNSEAILSGLTHLIENSMNVDELGMKQEADAVQEKLCSEASEKHIVVEYKMAVAANYLKNKKPEKCFENLRSTKSILDGLRTSVKTYTLNAKFWCLVSQFLAVYTQYKLEFGFSPDVDLRVIAFKAFSYANGGGKSDLLSSASQLECMELVLAMLEVNLWAYHLHGVYFQSNFMRFFLDDLYQIVQKLFLPTRTAEVLARLAEVDLICERVSDCHEKVAKLKAILGNASVIKSGGKKFEKSTSPYLSVPQRGDSEDSFQRPISPVRFRDKQPHAKELDLSPIHCYLEDAKSAAIKQHKKNCKCRLCQNLLIQVLTMNAFWLEAEIYNLGKSFKQAVECYNRAFEVLANLELAKEEQNRILRLQLASALRSVPGELDFMHNYVPYHTASFLIKYAQFELSNSKTDSRNALNAMIRISKIMKKLSYSEKLLEWVFAEVKLAYVYVKKDMKPPKKSTPEIFKTTGVTKTPVVHSQTNTAVADRKSSTKVKNSVHSKAVEEGITGSTGTSTDGDVMNTAFVDGVKCNPLKKVIQPKKLNFSSQKPETNATTVVKKALRPKENCLKSRKLNFDLPEDGSEEREKGQAEKANSLANTESRKCTLRSVSSKKDPQPVQIYKDAKDDGNSKTAPVTRSQRKALKK